MSRFIAFVVCVIAVLLPWRLRIVFSEILGWFVQGAYFAYYGILNYLIRELKNADGENKK